jgi:hypothetical protein
MLAAFGKRGCGTDRGNQAHIDQYLCQFCAFMPPARMIALIA